MRKYRQILIFVLVICASLLSACTAEIDELVGPSFNGNSIAIKALYGSGGLEADGSSQATIRVEVFTADGLMVDGATVTLTTTLGTLGASTLTTINGVATTTLTAGTTTGLAYIVATVENISATTAVPIVNI
jgi:hypothetical protein